MQLSRHRISSVAIVLAATLSWSIAAPAIAEIVNDVTQINPINVEKVIAPTTLDEIVRAVKTHSGPISIGGGRYSMGGQTATEGAVQLDMRRFDKIVSFSKEKKEITVEAGATWRKIQEFIDPQGLSIQIMQTYANFTVGGSLSVNVHGRYIGQGPLVLSVKSIRMVLADGRVVEASPTQNRDIFYGAIGGYGGLGVITHATLQLTDNVKVERQSTVMPLSAYSDFFFKEVRSNPNVIFHNADIYPRAYDTIRATSYVKTDKPVTVEDRLIPEEISYRKDRLALSVISEWALGPAFRQHVLDPWLYHGELVQWRNHEASYSVLGLEPRSRADSTYVLQEYFVPVAKLNSFAKRMAQTLNRHDVNAINISIRHAKRDPGTLLAWARDEVFAFVLYYKQGTSEADRRAVSLWTRELIDAAIEHNGSYYLPYQIHATDKQVRGAYPRLDEYFALKRRLDPHNKFRNKLWDAYYRPAGATVASLAKAAPAIRQDDVASDLKNYPTYQRDESQTYLTLPEWFLVYSPDEYAQFLRQHPPADFPYFGSIGQFWGYYRDAYRATNEKYGFNWGYHVMVFVIGSSFTVEHALKGIYENTVGRITEWLRNDDGTPEDRFAAKVAQEYVDFIRVDPWYEFPFASRLRKLWSETDLIGPNFIRKWERKLILSVEYAAKAQYALLIKLATKAAYGDADAEMLTLVTDVTPQALDSQPKIKALRRFDNGQTLLAMPRYEEFRDSAIKLSKSGVRFVEIAGNDQILLTAVVPANWRYDVARGAVSFERPILTDPSRKRVAIEVPVTSLHSALNGLSAKGVTVEHIYDY